MNANRPILDRERTAHALSVGGSRALTLGEKALVKTVFGHEIDCEPVRIHRRKWFIFQPRRVTMAPCGHIHFHPKGPAYSDDFAHENLSRQSFFIHEMTHVWQTQRRGAWYLITHRHPFCRYDYTLKPGQPLEAYGIEQQAMIVQHAFCLRNGMRLAGVADAGAYAALVNFPGASSPGG